MTNQLIITYSLTGSSKELLSIYPKADIAELTTTIPIPKTKLKAIYTVMFKKIGANYQEVPNYNLYEEIIIIIPVWMGKPARVFTEVFQKYPFKDKKVIIYLSSLSFEEKVIEQITKMIAVDNTVVKKWIYAGKKDQKKLVEIK